MIQIIIYTAVITATVVVSAFLAFHFGAFAVAYTMWLMGRSMFGAREAPFSEFYRQMFPRAVRGENMDEGR